MCLWTLLGPHPVMLYGFSVCMLCVCVSMYCYVLFICVRVAVAAASVFCLEGVFVICCLLRVGCVSLLCELFSVCLWCVC